MIRRHFTMHPLFTRTYSSFLRIEITSGTKIHGERSINVSRQLPRSWIRLDKNSANSNRRIWPAVLCGFRNSLLPIFYLSVRCFLLAAQLDSILLPVVTTMVHQFAYLSLCLNLKGQPSSISFCSLFLKPSRNCILYPRHYIMRILISPRWT